MTPEIADGRRGKRAGRLSRKSFDPEAASSVTLDWDPTCVGSFANARVMKIDHSNHQTALVHDPASLIASLAGPASQSKLPVSPKLDPGNRPAHELRHTSAGSRVSDSGRSDPWTALGPYGARLMQIQPSMFSTN